MNRCNLALRAIRLILGDDKNYQSDASKLGAIWDYCTWAAEYRRTNSNPPAIEVTLKK